MADQTHGLIRLVRSSKGWSALTGTLIAIVTAVLVWPSLSQDQKAGYAQGLITKIMLLWGGVIVMTGVEDAASKSKDPAENTQKPWPPADPRPVNQGEIESDNSSGDFSKGGIVPDSGQQTFVGKRETVAPANFHLKIPKLIVFVSMILIGLGCQTDPKFAAYREGLYRADEEIYNSWILDREQMNALDAAYSNAVAHPGDADSNAKLVGAIKNAKRTDSELQDAKIAVREARGIYQSGGPPTTQPVINP